MGRRLYVDGRFSEAAGEFRGALALFPGSAKLAFNLGRSLERAGDLAGAVAAYRRYVALDPQGDDLTPLIDGLNARITAARPTLVLSTAPAGARVLLDDAEAPLEARTPSRLQVDPGTHVLRFRLEGYAEAVRSVRADQGGERLVEVTLDAVAAQAPLPGEPGTPLRPWIGWGLLAAGVGAGVASGVLFGQATATADDADALGPAYAHRAERDALREDFDGQVLGGRIAGGLGVALVGGGLAVLLWPDDAPVTVSPSVGGAALSARF